MATSFSRILKKLSVAEHSRQAVRSLQLFLPFPEEPVEHWANGVLCVLPDLETRLAPDENLLTRSHVLAIARRNRDDSGPEQEIAHPSVAVREHTVGRLAQ